MTDVPFVEFEEDERLPLEIRTIFNWLFLDVIYLQSKWDFYLGLFGKDQNTDLLSELAPWSFNIIEESLRIDMTMIICRLSDPPKSRGNDNLSFSILIEKCSYIEGIEILFGKFKEACAPLKEHRNKLVAHKDLRSFIKPREYPLPGINKDQIEMILELATNILKKVLAHFGEEADISFHLITQGGADTLICYLEAGKNYYSEDHFSFPGSTLSNSKK